MKKIIFVLIFIITLLPIKDLMIVSADTPNESAEFVSRYKTWGSELTEDQLMQFYIENGIRPANFPDSDAVGRFSYADVAPHLSEKFPEYTSWRVSSQKSYVKDVYGENPFELCDHKGSKLIAAAKEQAGITYEDLGCGPIAILSQFDYLARSAGYVSIADNLEDFRDKTLEEGPNFIGLAKEVFMKTPTVPAESIIGKIFGAEPGDGTFTFPLDAVDTMKEILENHYLAEKKTEETVDEEGVVHTREYYDNESQIVVSGDVIPCLSSFSTKINNLKDSIDRGMPVIWWTVGGEKTDGFANHYMNIFGYEYWTGTDAYGNETDHLMFILRCNWDDDSDIYMDSDYLRANNCGFIFFEETHDKTLIRPKNYGYACQYPYEQQSGVVYSEMGYDFNSQYLRAGYVDRYDITNSYCIDQQLSLSAKRENAGEAYVQYEFSVPIKWIYVETSWWSVYEGIFSEDGKAHIEYRDYNGKWVKQFDLLRDIDGGLSSAIDNKSKLKCEFNYPVTAFRIYVQTNNPTGSRNKGRLVLGNIIVVHGEAHTHSYSYIPKGNSRHLVNCICGKTMSEPHAISADDIGGRYANCIQCGYRVDLDSDIVIVNRYPNECLYSENGSYILANGVVVLVNEDIEAYLDGSLTFRLRRSDEYEI